MVRTSLGLEDTVQARYDDDEVVKERSCYPGAGWQSRSAGGDTQDGEEWVWGKS